jgi:hypothetical protein
MEDSKLYQEFIKEWTGEVNCASLKRAKAWNAYKSRERKKRMFENFIKKYL